MEVTATSPVSVPVSQVDPNALYLRTNIVSGEGDGITFDLDMSGASLILTVKIGEEVVKQTMSFRDLATAWVNTVRVSL